MTVLSTICVVSCDTVTDTKKRKWGGSVVDMRPNKNREMEEVMSQFDDMYFKDRSIYDEIDFEKRFRMPRCMLNHKFKFIHGSGLFVRRKDVRIWEWRM